MSSFRRLFYYTAYIYLDATKLLFCLARFILQYMEAISIKMSSEAAVQMMYAHNIVLISTKIFQYFNLLQIVSISPHLFKFLSLSLCIIQSHVWIQTMMNLFIVETV